jgi:hypothetical protein
VRHALAVVVTAARIATEATRRHMHSARIEQLVAIRDQRRVRRAFEMRVAQRAKVPIRKPALHVHAVAAEENTEALDRALLSARFTRRQALQERQGKQGTAHSAQEVTTTL